MKLGKVLEHTYELNKQKGGEVAEHRPNNHNSTPLLSSLEGILPSM